MPLFEVDADPNKLGSILPDKKIFYQKSPQISSPLPYQKDF